jgi:hypothetical protein
MKKRKSLTEGVWINEAVRERRSMRTFITRK